MIKLKLEIMRIMKALLKSRVFTLVFFIANLFLIQNGFGQASPVRLKGSGGTITEINVSGVIYEVHTYTVTGSSTFTPPSGASSVEYLVVAGGGGGGNSTDRTGGGGGAGGVLSNSSYAVTAQGYPVTVGAGGAANTAGSNSVFATLTAVGGGRGGQSTGLSSSGGSGGGAYHNVADIGGSGTAGQGTAGGKGYDSGDGTNGSFAAGGGGGQSQAGANGVNTTGKNSNAGKGGDGFTSLISGTSTVYAGGGGGGFQHLGTSSGNSGSGGNGGGGAGGSGTGTAFQSGTAGTANRGSGGGGAGGTTSGAGGSGGSGIVIIRYTAPTMAITTQPSAIVPGGSNFAQPVVIQILNGNGVAVPGIVVTASIQSGTGGTLTNNTATTDASGNATFSNLQLSGPSGNAYTLNFQVPGSANVVVSNTINICGIPVSTVTGQTNITCNNASDGTITVSASGGASPYTFSINNGTYAAGSNDDTNVFTGLAPNTPYQIKVKDSNGCISK